MTKTRPYLATVFGIMAVIIVYTLAVNSQEGILGANSINDFFYGDSTATTTTLSAAVGKDNDIILSSNSARRFAVITNVGGTIAYLAYTNATSSTDIAAIPAARFNIPLVANGGSYTINMDNLYKGAIIATSTAAVEIRALEID